MKIFINGPMQGRNDYGAEFDEVTMLLEKRGHVAMHPALFDSALQRIKEFIGFPEFAEWTGNADIKETERSFRMLMIQQADAIFCMGGWQHDADAALAYGFAVGIHKKIYIEIEDVPDIACANLKYKQVYDTREKVTKQACEWWEGQRGEASR